MSKRKTCGKFSQSQKIQTSKSGFERHTRKGGKTNVIQVVLYLTNRIKRTISAGIWSCTSGIVHVNVAALTTTTKSFMRCDNDFSPSRSEKVLFVIFITHTPRLSGSVSTSAFF